MNLKTYPAVLGPKAVRIAEVLEAAGRAAGVAVAVAPALPDLGRVAASVAIPVLAQHVDAGGSGARTGSVPGEALLAAGAAGSLVNHSERPVPEAGVRQAIEELGRLGLVAVVCAPDARTSARFARFAPPYLAVEPPELIGGRRSVSSARPALIRETVEGVRKISPSTQVLCGAGIHSSEDVRRALELGSRGVLVASAVTGAPRPRVAIEQLLSGF